MSAALLARLLRLQEVRERRKRGEADKAAREEDAAAAQEQARAADLEGFRASYEARLDAVYAGMVGIGIARMQLDAAADLERSLRRQDGDLRDAWHRSQAHLVESQNARRAAVTVLQTEVRRSEARTEAVRRQRIALRPAHDLAEEGESQDDAAAPGTMS